jgi:tRNA(Phe) wybutosine-synthesizing methylase Tyw3
MAAKVPRLGDWCGFLESAIGSQAEEHRKMAHIENSEKLEKNGGRKAESRVTRERGVEVRLF